MKLCTVSWRTIVVVVVIVLVVFVWKKSCLFVWYGNCYQSL